MSTRLHPITLAIAVVAAAACGNKAELHLAQHSVYDTDFAIVYSETMTAVQKLYPNFQEDAAKGMIQTAWHPVAYANTSGDDAATHGMGIGGLGGSPGMSTSAQPGATGLPQATNGGVTLTKKYFVRFDVSIVGGRPWRVHVVGHASEWDPGNAEPTELRGANTPHWLGGRTDELMIAIYERLKPYGKEVPDEPPPPDEHDGLAPVDTAAFGSIPPAAAKAAGDVQIAIEKRDYTTLRTLVADDVQWSLGADPGADAALAMWQADPSTLDALIATMKLGCAPAKDAKKVVCPAKAATDGYLGWRATFEQRGAAWKLTSFVDVE
ncbi:MAG TPA: hypothetical protein VL463_33010 [Kofleriaceae bacterium]|nr:hypothetical protein [Kofleriaceae bacterium]